MAPKYAQAKDLQPLERKERVNTARKGNAGWRLVMPITAMAIEMVA